MMLTARFEKQLGEKRLQVDFAMEEELFGLLGASGSGKSMTLKCIAGIETPDKGYIAYGDKVFFDSEKKINLAPQERAVGYLFQDYALFPHLSVLENVCIVCKDESKAKQLLMQYHVEELAPLYPRQLSGGQKQRVAIARMMASNPDIILLDEPFSALDSFLRSKLEREMTLYLKGMQKPVILVTHDRDEVFHMCQRVAPMVNCRMQKGKEVKEFFRVPDTLEAARLSGCKNIAALTETRPGTWQIEKWGIEIASKKHKGDAVGIRAHSFFVTKSSESDWVFPVRDAKVIEDLFEYTVLFKVQKDDNFEWLEWKFSKTLAPDIPLFLYVKEEDVLWLSKEKND